MDVGLKKADKQTFIQIPYATFIEMIRYKAERLGIQVIDREESYTSKSSFLNNDPIPTYGEEHQTINFSGYRCTRAFYKLKGVEDSNSRRCEWSLNIVRKHVKKLLKDLKENNFLRPKKILHHIKKIAK